MLQLLILIHKFISYILEIIIKIPCYKQTLNGFLREYSLRLCRILWEIVLRELKTRILRHTPYSLIIIRLLLLLLILLLVGLLVLLLRSESLMRGSLVAISHELLVFLLELAFYVLLFISFCLKALFKFIHFFMDSLFFSFFFLYSLLFFS